MSLINTIWSMLDETTIQCANCSTIATTEEALTHGWLVSLFEGNVVNVLCPDCVVGLDIAYSEINPAFVEFDYS